MTTQTTAPKVSSLRELKRRLEERRIQSHKEGDNYRYGIDFALARVSEFEAGVKARLDNLYKGRNFYPTQEQMKIFDSAIEELKRILSSPEDETPSRKGGEAGDEG